MVIVLGKIFIENELFAAKTINVLLMMWGAYLLFQIGKRYLNGYYNATLLVLYGLSSSLLYYKINILSENLYIPLFLLLVLLLHKFLEKQRSFNALLIGLTIGCMYLTRGEAFIYLGSITVLFFLLSTIRYFTFWEWLRSLFLTFLWFFIIATPYIFHLHSITGERWLSNKGASNIRQAMMRGIEHMDDDGFEKAVWELDETKTKLISGFVGGLKYEKPSWEYSLKKYITSDVGWFLNNFEQNQKKLYTQTIPNMIIWDIWKFSRDINYPFAQTFPFLFILFLPLFFIIYGLGKMLTKREINLIVTVLPLFLTASLFFTLFFVLERYFIIFLPLALIVMLYGAQNLFWTEGKIHLVKFVIFSILLIWIQWIWFWYNHHLKVNTEFHIKKITGEWIQKNKERIFPWKENLKIMERWPVVTYYSWEKERWLTPYTDSVNDLITYAKANQIDILVVDTLDFLKYRPWLNSLLLPDWKYRWLEKITSFKNEQHKVILYKFTY
jgi:hypothetical protein